MKHNPVLLREVIKYLDPKPGESFIDATVGDGGHARAILERTGPDGRLLGIDWDLSALVVADKNKKRPRRDTGSMVREPEPPRTGSLNQRDRSGIALRPLDGTSNRLGRLNLQLVLKQGNFGDIFQIAGAAGFKQVSGALFDLGLRSGQVDEPNRGFSYLKDGPLDMRFHNTQTGENYLTAAEIVNEWPEEKLIWIFKEYGEEKDALKIARVIAAARSHKRIETTGELAEIIKGRNGTKGMKWGNKTLARIFQALRIAVNNELENLKKGLAGAWSLLEPEGRLAVISFHSLEDRIVKQFFRDKRQTGEGKILTPKPIVSSESEIKDNPRSRSAKLRAVMKIPNVKIQMPNKYQNSKSKEFF